MGQYYNDTQEIDMEFLSQDLNITSHPVNLVLQSPASEQAGFDAANTGTFQAHELPYDPSSAFHEYRFDWSPDLVSFYADGVLLDTMNKAIPTSAGHITLSHWSNGNPDWSAGPPTTDAIMTVEYVKGYFNSSDPSRQKDWQERCKDPSALNATCAIPEVMEAPNGNMSADTFFFSTQFNSTVNQTVFGTKKKSEGTSLGLSSWKQGLLGTFVSLLVILWVFRGL
jgi:beta-glucanase (GH16 family)